MCWQFWQGALPEQGRQVLNPSGTTPCSPPASEKNQPIPAQQVADKQWGNLSQNVHRTQWQQAFPGALWQLPINRTQSKTSMRSDIRRILSSITASVAAPAGTRMIASRSSRTEEATSNPDYRDFNCQAWESTPISCVCVMKGSLHAQRRPYAAGHLAGTFQ